MLSSAGAEESQPELVPLLTHCEAWDLAKSPGILSCPQVGMPDLYPLGGGGPPVSRMPWWSGATTFVNKPRCHMGRDCGHVSVRDPLTSLHPPCGTTTILNLLPTRSVKPRSSTLVGAPKSAKA